MTETKANFLLHNKQYFALSLLSMLVFIWLFNYFLAKDGSLVADYELQAWGEEIVRPRDEGGVGTLVSIYYSLSTSCVSGHI